MRKMNTIEQNYICKYQKFSLFHLREIISFKNRRNALFEVQY